TDHTLPIDEEGRWSGNVFLVLPSTLVHHPRRLDQLPVGIRHHDKVREHVLGSLGGFEVFTRGNHNTDISLFKFRMIFFDLTELNHADRSPPTAEEYEHRLLVSF